MATTAEIERVEAKIIAQQGAKSCDKYDYLIATGCGVVAGLVDIFFVGMPGESKLGGWTDAQVDKAVAIDVHASPFWLKDNERHF